MTPPLPTLLSIRHVYDNEATGTDFKEWRIYLGVSQRKVAQHMNRSAQYLCDLEQGLRAWSEELVEQYTTAVSKLVEQAQRT